jgi:hypothetical protein
VVEVEDVYKWMGMNYIVGGRIGKMWCPIQCEWGEVSVSCQVLFEDGIGASRRL